MTARLVNDDEINWDCRLNTSCSCVSFYLMESNPQRGCYWNNPDSVAFLEDSDLRVVDTIPSVYLKWGRILSFLSSLGG